MTGPVIAVAWQSRFVDGKWSECSREHVEWVRSVPHEWPGYEVRELYAAPQPAPAIDLEQFREVVSYASSAAAVNTHTELEARFRSLLALIDGQANVRSSSEHSEPLTPVAHKKLQGLQAEGFIVNGVAIFNPATGQRGLVDYLGYVGWQTSEKPSKGEGVACV